MYQEAMEKSRVKGFLHADGILMKNGEDQEVLLRGWGMGNWNNPEGFMLGGVSHFNIGRNGEVSHMGRLDRGRSMDLILRETCGTKYTEEFWKKWHRSYLMEEDIRLLSQLGYNSVRLPIRACCFLYEEPGICFNEDSFEMLTQILNWCEKYSVYAVIDLHAAVGAQSCLPCDDGFDNSPHLFLDEESMERTLVLCQELARRYADRWIVGAFDMINEPLSAIAPDPVLEGKLKEFYLEMIRRMRQVDKNHLILLNGTMFSAKVHIFDRDYDPECHNWGVSIHCYRSRPETASFGNALRMRERLNIPVWMGETGGGGEWMSSLYELLLEHHIGFNIWCWKACEGASCAGVLRFTLPDGWQEIVDYADKGGAKPSYARAQAIWNRYLETVRPENCRLEKEVHGFVLRNGAFSLPAVCYDALPEGSFSGSCWEGSFVQYRSADRMDIVYPDGWEQGPTPMGAPQGDEEFDRMVLALHSGNYASYTYRPCQGEREVVLEYRARPGSALKVSAGDLVLYQGEVPGAAEFTDLPVKAVPAGQEGQVRVESLSGEVLLRRIRFQG